MDEEFSVFFLIDILKSIKDNLWKIRELITKQKYYKKEMRNRKFVKL